MPIKKCRSTGLQYADSLRSSMAIDKRTSLSQPPPTKEFSNVGPWNVEDGEDGPDGDEAVDVGRAVQRIEADNVLSLYSKMMFLDLNQVYY